MLDSETEMRKFFQQKYILRILAFAVLALVAANVSLPKINEYNAAIKEEQIKLKIEANGIDDRKISLNFILLEV